MSKLFEGKNIKIIWNKTDAHIKIKVAENFRKKADRTIADINRITPDPVVFHSAMEIIPAINTLKTIT